MNKYDSLVDTSRTLTDADWERVLSQEYRKTPRKQESILSFLRKLRANGLSSPDKDVDCFCYADQLIVNKLNPDLILIPEKKDWGTNSNGFDSTKLRLFYRKK